METSYNREGYLNEDFRFFHLKDTQGQEYSFHYHEFDKIVIFLSGKVNYHIEGASYDLKPWDILLVNHNLIHKAGIDTSVPYERMIIYLNTEFVNSLSTEKTDLMRAFSILKEKENHLLRPQKAERDRLEKMLMGLKAELNSEKYASDIMTKARFLELLAELNRIAEDKELHISEEPIIYDPKLSDILGYINDNLSSDLSVELLSEKCFLSKYHFMRRFKEMTGYTVHSYIQHKRLFLSAELLREGKSPSEAAEMSGFGEYSTFLRAFKKMYGVTPGKFS